MHDWSSTYLGAPAIERHTKCNKMGNYTSVKFERIVTATPNESLTERMTLGYLLFRMKSLSRHLGSAFTFPP